MRKYQRYPKNEAIFNENDTKVSSTHINTRGDTLLQEKCMKEASHN